MEDVSPLKPKGIGYLKHRYFMVTMCLMPDEKRLMFKNYMKIVYC